MNSRDHCSEEQETKFTYDEKEKIQNAIKMFFLEVKNILNNENIENIKEYISYIKEDIAYFLNGINYITIEDKDEQNNIVKRKIKQNTKINNKEFKFCGGYNIKIHNKIYYSKIKPLFADSIYNIITKHKRGENELKKITDFMINIFKNEFEYIFLNFKLSDPSLINNLEKYIQNFFNDLKKIQIKNKSELDSFVRLIKSTFNLNIFNIIYNKIVTIKYNETGRIKTENFIFSGGSNFNEDTINDKINTLFRMYIYPEIKKNVRGSEKIELIRKIILYIFKNELKEFYEFYNSKLSGGYKKTRRTLRKY